MNNLKSIQLVDNSDTKSIFSFNFCSDSLILCYNDRVAIISLSPLLRLLAVTYPGQILNAAIFNGTNCLLLASNPTNPAFAHNKLILYDAIDHAITSTIEFNKGITEFKTSASLVSISVHDSVYLYAVDSEYNPVLLHKHNTHSNPITQLNTHGKHSLFISSGLKLGHLHVAHLHSKTHKSTNLFQAHTSKVSAVAISPNNSSFATTSVKGTIIRIFNSTTLQCTHQLRRGSDLAIITSSSLAFSPDSTLLALVSDKSSVHLWNLDIPTLKSSKYTPNYFNHSRSTATYHLPALNIHSSLSPFITSSQHYANYSNFQESFILTWESPSVILVASTYGRLFKLSVTARDTGSQSHTLQSVDFKNFLHLLTL
ncbi:hypothetical protein E3P99_03448 [Wallemia hederae]|uniref:Uncharacterized protein n=1 Tax=Wallemia hederae TaxID=1540922 RepID=A0A4T0FG57_9BASI|nr:hypothetical protein E3P99_03448 [Wallemia hederae]